MRRAATALVSVVVVLLTPLYGASPASAVSPWWHLTSGSRPANLQPGPATDEVQQMAVIATGGEFEMYTERFPFNAEASALQAGLESHFGAGNVQVTGGPGGSKPYVVTFTGSLAGESVAPLVALSELIGPGAGVNVTEATRGRSGGTIVVTAADIGDANVNSGAAPVVIHDTLPHGLRALTMEAVAGGTSSPGPVVCEVSTLTCTFSAPTMPAYDQIEVRIRVEVEEGAPAGGENLVSVSGGETPDVSLRRPLRMTGASAPFGGESYEVTPEDEGGATDTQAGSHPFQLTTTFTLNQSAEESSSRGGQEANPVALAKDLRFKLPAGLIGNPNAFPRCTLTQFFARPSACPQQTVLGVAIVTINEPESLGIITIASPVYNLEPAIGEPARFGFFPSTAAQLPASTPVFLDASIRTGSDYGVTVSSSNIVQEVSFLSNTVTFWGVPGDARHDNQRGQHCINEARLGNACQPLAENNPPPFLDLPTSCTGPLQTSVEADSWKEPTNPVALNSSEPLPALDGCNRLPFSSEIKLSTDGQAASTPTGLTADVHVPQEEALNAKGLAPSDVKSITVTLPEDVVLNPAAADGLASCTEAQIALSSDSEPSCPNASKIASVTIHTPLLPDPLKGFVYLASPQNFSGLPQENPFDDLVAMYIVAKDPVSGVLVKLPARVSLSETGQVTTTVESPQLPFEDAELEFFGGDRAPLATPAHCGFYTTHASFAPWSGGESVSSSSTFQITTGPNGSPCPGPALPFSPSLTAGSPNINAAAFSPLTTTISRDDGNQNIQTVVLHLAPGMSGILSGIPLCPEAQANAGTCGPKSLIGETIVGVGLGGDPFSVTGGKVYITGKYAGAPFGLSIVNPAKAGPFNLQEGRPVVVRAKIEIDPTTAALTIVTDPSGPHAIPHIIEGIPLQIKHVNVLINRPGFTFNPTNCNPMAIAGTIGSFEGASSSVSVPFQVTNCAVLKFAPKFTVSTSAKTSKANGASLTTKVAEPAGALGTQANIAKVKVELPKQLPSRLTTLQKACTNAQFESNPAGCPAASVIGHATVHTPLLPVPLTGPAIFVSHGGEAFPSLIIVLQGYGVTIDLVGTTFINKAGVTSTTFKTVPDTPFSTFELTLPQGRFSALASNLPAKAKGRFCGQKLRMPTEFVGQNGALIRQSTPISVTGCPKKKALTRKQKLAKALTACKRKPKGRRAACLRAAHRRYGVVARRKKK